MTYSFTKEELENFKDLVLKQVTTSIYEMAKTHKKNSYDPAFNYCLIEVDVRDYKKIIENLEYNLSEIINKL
jgi:thiamine pyrophosphokinase